MLKIFTRCHSLSIHKSERELFACQNWIHELMTRKKWRNQKHHLRIFVRSIINYERVVSADRFKEELSGELENECLSMRALLNVLARAPYMNEKNYQHMRVCCANSLVMVLIYFLQSPVRKTFWDFYYWIFKNYLICKFR